MRRRQRDRRRAEQAGRLAETASAWLLRLKGYQILDQRARTRRGEIDLIAKRGQVIAFVEVKYRASRNEAIEAVSDQNWRRIAAAAEVWMSKRPSLARYNWRYDLIALAPGRLPHHLTDYWRP